MNATKITVQVSVEADAKKVWNCWTAPEHITKWNFASDDWHCPEAKNDVRTGGRFSSIMAAKDGSMSFEFGGVYDEVVDGRKIAYTMDDGRQAVVDFEVDGDAVNITTVFDAEETNPVEMQRGGWQAILNNFKKYAEANG